MGFTDLDTDSGISSLDRYIQDKSYIEGFEPSQADVSVFEAIRTRPDSKKFPNAARWYSHLESKRSSFAGLPGVKKAAGEYGPLASVGQPSTSKHDDDVDLFGSDSEEDAELERQKAQRLAEYQAKKAAKGPGPVAKSSVLLDVKPWDDTTDLGVMEKEVRAIQMDGLLWGASQLVPIGYGIRKLQISCVIEDDKVGTDMLEEAITGIEEHVQSMDIASFNKI
jgi:elongation factor 1-beta